MENWGSYFVTMVEKKKIDPVWKIQIQWYSLTRSHLLSFHPSLLSVVSQKW